MIAANVKNDAQDTRGSARTQDDCRATMQRLVLQYVKPCCPKFPTQRRNRRTQAEQYITCLVGNWSFCAIGIPTVGAFHTQRIIRLSQKKDPEFISGSPIFHYLALKSKPTGRSWGTAVTQCFTLPIGNSMAILVPRPRDAQYRSHFAITAMIVCAHVLRIIYGPFILAAAFHVLKSWVEKSPWRYEMTIQSGSFVRASSVHGVNQLATAFERSIYKSREVAR